LLGCVLPIYANCAGIFQILFIALLKPPFKSSEDYRHIGWDKKAEHAKATRGQEAKDRGLHDGSF
jgi:hypothetical protein